jgi:hypothetical protein
MGFGVLLVAGSPVGVNRFHFFPGFSALAIVAAALATNEIGYAGDTSAATVTVMTDRVRRPLVAL